MPAEGSRCDVLIVGAGISGIGAGYYLKNRCPDRSFAILEGRSDLGGTWDLFRYPGVRSDSDMHTLSYSFKPWTGDRSISDGQSILDYLRETAVEHHIDQHIRFNHHVTRAEWSTETSCWTVTALLTDSGDTATYTCNFLFMCSGYYSYKSGYSPEFPGRERFNGPIIHPQEWPADLDYRDKNVAVIGSGATAVTLVPAMAADANHVTMIQRSPTYMVSRPSVDPWAKRLRRLLPDRVAHLITRWLNIIQHDWVYRATRTRPERIKKILLGLVRKEMGPDYDIDTHFRPTYDPWDQRLCLVPDSDFFRAVKSGEASIVTDTIDSFTDTGIALASGGHVEADIIITATGLQLVTLGEVDFVVDGKPVNFADTWTYKGLAYSGVPNLVSSFGYINSSWTLRVDLTCNYVCRLLNHMTETGTTKCTPTLRPEDADMPARPWIDDFSAGYISRMAPLMPKQGDRQPWLNPQRYLLERKQFRRDPIDDGVMLFEAPPGVDRSEQELLAQPSL
jgi:cation diffusion facilitator CzcD-associated flavoprotein CzcO